MLPIFNNKLKEKTSKVRSYLIINEDEQLNARGAMTNNSIVSSNANVPASPYDTLQLLHTPKMKFYFAAQ